MKKIALAILVISSLIGTMFTVFLLSTNKHIIKDEQRIATIFPSLPKNITSITLKQYFTKVDNFFADNFPFRTSLIHISTYINEYLDDNIEMNTCFYGKEGWLFLGNKYNQTIDKLEGRLTMSTEHLALYFNSFYERHQLCNLHVLLIFL